jgi:hypothetical protein
MEKYPQLAKRIKQLRTNEGYTWRAIAEQINKEYPKLDINTYNWKNFTCVNQVDGIALCEAAMKYLNETIKNGWN